VFKLPKAGFFKWATYMCENTRKQTVTFYVQVVSKTKYSVNVSPINNSWFLQSDKRWGWCRSLISLSALRNAWQNTGTFLIILHLSFFKVNPIYISALCRILQKYLLLLFRLVN